MAASASLYKRLDVSVQPCNCFGLVCTVAPKDKAHIKEKAQTS